MEMETIIQDYFDDLAWQSLYLPYIYHVHPNNDLNVIIDENELMENVVSVYGYWPFQGELQAHFSLNIIRVPFHVYEYYCASGEVHEDMEQSLRSALFRMEKQCCEIKGIKLVYRNVSLGCITGTSWVEDINGDAVSLYSLSYVMYSEKDCIETEEEEIARLTKLEELCNQ